MRAQYLLMGVGHYTAWSQEDHIEDSSMVCTAPSRVPRQEGRCPAAATLGMLRSSREPKGPVAVHAAICTALTLVCSFPGLVPESSCRHSWCHSGCDLLSVALAFCGRRGQSSPQTQRACLLLLRAEWYFTDVEGGPVPPWSLSFSLFSLVARTKNISSR